MATTILTNETEKTNNKKMYANTHTYIVLLRKLEPCTATDTDSYWLLTQKKKKNIKRSIASSQLEIINFLISILLCIRWFFLFISLVVFVFAVFLFSKFRSIVYFVLLCSIFDIVLLLSFTLQILKVKIENEKCEHL